MTWCPGHSTRVLLPSLQKTYGHEQVFFSFFNFRGSYLESTVRGLGALTDKNIYRIVLGSGQSRPCGLPAPGQGVLTWLSPKQISVELLSGLSQEFLVRAPGHLPNRIVIHFGGQLFHRGGNQLWTFMHATRRL